LPLTTGFYEQVAIISESSNITVTS